ncbi:MAG: sulfite exporter TauE/SafE family protein [Desulfuromonadaceae bacterium]|nr:sulfite exporter TauE/SafE family protein [Desulfuromonadaceae bacterium]
MIDPLYTMAFMTGLLGFGHCIGMCGGLVGALSLSHDGRAGGITFHLLYNLGRTMTYTVIGLAVGWVGSAMAYTDHFRQITRYLLLGSDLFVILIGIGTAGLLTWLNVMKLEFPGPLQAMSQAVGSLRNHLPPALAALPLGMLFGFLPCGFLYAMFITAAQSASPVKGALTMFFFGLGTAPALLLFGTAAQRLGMASHRWMIRAAGAMVALMGCYNLYRHLKMFGWIGKAAGMDMG